jgi:hypothetical protein
VDVRRPSALAHHRQHDERREYDAAMCPRGDRLAAAVPDFAGNQWDALDDAEDGGRLAPRGSGTLTGRRQDTSGRGSAKPRCLGGRPRPDHLSDLEHQPRLPLETATGPGRGWSTYRYSAPVPVGPATVGAKGTVGQDLLVAAAVSSSWSQGIPPPCIPSARTRRRVSRIGCRRGLSGWPLREHRRGLWGRRGPGGLHSAGRHGSMAAGLRRAVVLPVEDIPSADVSI